MSIAELPIGIDGEAIARFCRERGIRKLSLFGSVLRDDLDPQRSDVDVVVEFLPEAHPGLSFFGYGEELSRIIGCKVDFNTPAWLSKYFREDLMREALTVYEQASPERQFAPDCGVRAFCPEALRGQDPF